METFFRVVKPEAPALDTTTTPSTTDDRAPLRSLVTVWAHMAGTNHSFIWPQVKAHFQLARIDDLPKEWIPDALAFVQGKIDALSAPQTSNTKPKALPKAKQKLLPAAQNGTLPVPHLYNEPQHIEETLNRLQVELFQKTTAFMEDMKNLSGQTRAAFNHAERVSNVGTVFDVFLSEQCRVINALAEQSYDCGATAVRQIQALQTFAPHLKKVFG